VTQVTTRPAYLAKKLSYALPTKDGEVLRTIQDARDHLLTLPPQRALRNHWQQACKLILDEADPAAVSQQVHRALFMDSKLDLSEFERMNSPRR
jgi:hypothetical protein